MRSAAVAYTSGSRLQASVFLERHFLFARLLVTGQKIPNYIHGTSFNGDLHQLQQSAISIHFSASASSVKKVRCRWKSGFTVGER